MRRSTFAVAGLLLIGGCGDDDPAKHSPPRPMVTTGGLVVAGTDTARVNGIVDAFGERGSFWFEFGTDVSYGESTEEAAIPTTSAGPHTVEGTLRGLPPDTMIHFRLVARTAGGRGEGEAATFFTRPANLPPDTQVVGAGSDTSATVVSAALFWFGSDVDGEVARFEWRLADHGADGALDVADSLDVPWAMTAVTDSVFTWSDDIGSRTFFVRAIDDRDARDPTPASWTFEAVEPESP